METEDAAGQQHEDFGRHSPHAAEIAAHMAAATNDTATVMPPSSALVKSRCADAVPDLCTSANICYDNTIHGMVQNVHIGCEGFEW